MAQERDNCVPYGAGFLPFPLLYEPKGDAKSSENSPAGRQGMSGTDCLSLNGSCDEQFWVAQAREGFPKKAQCSVFFGMGNPEQLRAAPQASPECPTRIGLPSRWTTTPRPQPRAGASNHGDFAFSLWDTAYLLRTQAQRNLPLLGAQKWGS